MNRTASAEGSPASNPGFWRDRPNVRHGRDGPRRELARSPARRPRSGRGLPRTRLGSPERAGALEEIDRVRVVRGDICDQPLLERTLGEYEIATVMHLAAQTIVGIANRNPVSTFQTNIAGTWSLLEACRRSPKVGQVVVASSDKAYGDE